MKKTHLVFLTVLFSMFSLIGFSQTDKSGTSSDPSHPTLISQSEPMIEVPSIASQIANGTFIPSENHVKEFNPKKWGSNTAVPGKGLPKGDDPLWEKQTQAPKSQGRAPLLSFDAASSGSTPTDPTGAVGPNHFVNSWNSSFRIWDKSGNPLIAAASLGTVLPGTLGDPIVMYDRYADRFIITEFYSNGFDVAISKGPDPLNSGWYVYRFPTNTFPDYPKFSVWSDGYYITANKDQSSASTSQVVFVVERTKMIAGNTSAQMVGFPLTNIVTSGFYSPLGFNANGITPPPAGNASIVYMQDDAWYGVASDHLKLWTINVNWTTPASSTISTPQIITIAPFDGLFDGGSFSNLPQPSGGDIDALQATIMYMAQYRRFSGYNSAIFNFVVDLNGADNKAGIRWYELRQTVDGGAWSIFQEGTYSQPNGHSAFSGNMCMDANGNIGLAYTTVSTTQYPSLRFTGRQASDPAGTMTIAEEVIINGVQSDPSTRYGDYSQMTVDPVDDATFWSIGEYFASGTRKNRVGTFQIGPPALNAAFTANPTTICSGGTVSFTNQSSGLPTSWLWSFPGGTPGSFNGQNPPSITYSTAGTYNVTLTVSDGSTTDVETKTGYIAVKNIVADFTGTPTSVVVGNSVTFTDISSCSPTTWAWSFPGGTPSSSNLQNPPPITYSTLGTYNVELTVTKPGGTDTKTKTGYITVISPEFVMANGTISTCSGNFYDPGGASGSYSNNQNFTMVINPGVAGNLLKVVFNSFSLEAEASCGYDYLKIYNGNSISSSLIGTWCGTNSPGTITASNATGSLTFVFHSDVSITASGWSAAISCTSTAAPPVAGFTASGTNPAINSAVTFTDQSTNGPTSWAWSFTPNTVVYINSTTAGSQNPQVQFNALGLYTVSLTAANAYGSDNETKASYINVTSCSVCSSTSTNATEEWISNVTFNTINNTSAGSIGYQNFTAISTNVNRGSVYSLSASCGSTGSWAEHCWAFADWNQDCDFTDTGESFDLGQVTGPGTMTLSITIPSGATIGSTRLRVSLKYNADPTSCETLTYGQVEDYTMNIQSAAPTLSVSPSNQNVTAAAGNVSFAVTSNTSWTVSSSQVWCTVTPSGSGNGTITAAYQENTSVSARTANITITATGLTPLVVTITQAGVPCINPTAFAGNDATITDTENLPLTGVASNYSAVLWTSSGDGNFDDPGLPNPVYYPGPQDKLNETVELLLTTYPNLPCTMLASDDLMLTIMRQQFIEFPAGWSGFSSFVVPLNPAFDVFISPVADKLMVAKTITQVYWPMFEINTIGNFQVLQGYVVKMNAQASLPVTGFKSVDKTIYLTGGWNILPVVSESEVGYQELINHLGVNLIILTEIAGSGIIWPEAEVFTIPSLVPGKAYMIKVTANCSFTFPD
jgi:PKD repeat protein